MNGPTPEPEVQARLCKIIAGALIAGVTMFLAIVLFLRMSGGKGLLAVRPWDLAPAEAVVSLVGLAMAVMLLILAPVVARSMTTSLRAKLAEDKPITPESVGMGQQASLRLAYQMRMIVQFAMVEGAAFFNLIAFLLEGRLPNLIAVFVLLALMVVWFPSRGSIDAFVDEQSELLQQERQSA